MTFWPVGIWETEFGKFHFNFINDNKIEMEFPNSVGFSYAYVRFIPSLSWKRIILAKGSSEKKLKSINNEFIIEDEATLVFHAKMEKMGHEFVISKPHTPMRKSSVTVVILGMSQCCYLNSIKYKS